MPTVNDGVIVVGSQTIGYTEREVYVYWDVAPDLRSNRSSFVENPFYRFFTARYATHEHIAYTYITRWVHVEYEPTPVTERGIYVGYALCIISDRTVYWYPDTRDRYAFVESIYTNTPLLLKYPKYFNWSYIPQIINPEFRIWSYYPLREDDITLKILTDTGTVLYYNSGNQDTEVKIEKETEYIYKITFYIDHVFEPGETVSCYLSAYDVKNNYLKEGMW